MKWIKNNASTILSCAASVGVIGTAVLAVKAAPKAQRAKEQARQKKGSDLTVPETIKAETPSYIPTALAGTATIGCIFGANILDRRQQAALTAAYAALETAYQNYRQKSDEICGVGTSHVIDRAIEQEQIDKEEDEPPWDRVQTFYIQDHDEFFERTMQQVMQAEYHLNRNFILRGYVTFNEFLEFLFLPPVADGNIGWDQFDGEAFYGYRWIDFDHRHYTTDDGLNVCAIEMPFGPHPLGEVTEFNDKWSEMVEEGSHGGS